MRATHRLAPALAALLIVSACGGDDEPAEGTDTGDAAATTAESTTDTGGATEEPTATGGATATAGEGDGGLGSLGLATSTPAGTQPVDSITWALYRDVNNLDPVFAFDYPENTTIALLCEQPLRQAPDGTIVPGLADVTSPDETTYVITLKDRRHVLER
ncbi:MAG: hypothetical protein R2697_19060 [Ilumatobacteraceae bacterium]